MTDEEKVTEKKNKVQPEENIERLKKIRQKRTSGVSMKYMAGAGAAVAVAVSYTHLGRGFKLEEAV